MCGIAGVASLTRPLGPDAERDLRGMLEMQAHRGPDDLGIVTDEFVALGANRLAIMDPSPRGHMPMRIGTDWLVFNGEIYNHVELRAELAARGHRFESTGDTEVLLRCLQEFGVDGISRLRGMFAFAWWSGRAQRLVLARDRVGIKPLSYRLEDGVLTFASESKVIGWRNARVDPTALAAYVAGRPGASTRTFFADVVRLPPATYAILSGGELTVAPYWSLPPPARDRESQRITDDDVDDLIASSVRLHLRSDVAVGAYLSGGLDSSLVASIAAAELGEVPTFSGAVASTDRRFDERAWVRTALTRIPGQHHHVLIDHDRWWADLLQMVWYLDEPVAGPASPAHYAVSRLAAEHVKVVLGGQGGDEIFLGYYRHLWAHARDLVAQRDVVQLASGVPSMARVLGDLGPRAIVDKFRRRAVTSALLRRPTSLAADIEPEAHGAETELARVQRSDLTAYLPTLLHVEDRASMAASVEARVPLVDHTLIEALWPVTQAHLPKLRLKGLLRRIAARHVAPAIARRHDKRGFPIPIGSWFAGPLSDRVAAVLDSDAVDRHEVFDRARLRTMLRRHRAGSVDASVPLWTALSVELWFATFVDRSGDSPLAG